MRKKLSITGVYDKKVRCPQCCKIDNPYIAEGITVWEDWGDAYDRFDKPRLYCRHCDKHLGKIDD